MTQLSAFRAAFAPADELLVPPMLAATTLPPDAETRVQASAIRLIDAIRADASAIGGVEDVLRAYSLSTREGLALMMLAEALLRVPDAATANRFLEDKLGQGDWIHHEPKGEALLVSASAWALGLTARLIHPGETPSSLLAGVVKRLGLPAVRVATRQAMRAMADHFVLGETIEAALDRAGSAPARVRHSFDMLGEGARTAADADRYLASYTHAITAIGRRAGSKALPDRPGISIKLSALHPRYEAVSQPRVLAELGPRLLDLARLAKGYDLNLTVDAEEADRLELSLAMIARVLADPSLKGWHGFGLAIQAYSKRILPLVDHLVDLATALDRRLMVRLVKGAYWDTEVKRAQERGLADYPVWTRKAVTDLAYSAAADRLLAAKDRIFAQFATHNARTVADILERAGTSRAFEFQRLHGMGEALYRRLLAEREDVAVRVYAPVGGHRDLLAYLVRRLLENGANSSFVAVAADPAVPALSLVQAPSAAVLAGGVRARRVGPPTALYGAARAAAPGVEFGDAAALSTLLAEVTAAKLPTEATSRINGAAMAGTRRSLTNPATGSAIGTVVEIAADQAEGVMQAAVAGFRAWDRTPVSHRAATLTRAADSVLANRGMLLALLQTEAGKTLDDALAELREAVDFCRYYAAEAEQHFAAATVLPGPTGEDNRLSHRGRGVIVAISPWNFPLAIFIGQVAAALVAGNSVVAKPAEQTPLIAAVTVALLHRAGVPTSALQLALGDGRVGAALVAHPAVAGVVFTGSTETAWRINRALAEKSGPIVPLIAETGGINAMIVDATALPEQVADDVVMSAFRSAGQRCSALRLLCLQDDIADHTLALIQGAAAELALGDPADIATHIGPVIDADAKAGIERAIAAARSAGRLIWQAPAPSTGHFVGPAILRVDRVADLTTEVFGPVLHVLRWRAEDLDQLIDQIASTGYGLTLGVHSRIAATADAVVQRVQVGNIYVNRSMIGAVVGTQPFGGSGLSGTGPKAGGPHYLMRFALEQVVTTNTAAAGGNATLLAETED